MKIIRRILIAVLVTLLLLSVTSIGRRVLFDDPVPLTFGYGTAVIVGGSMEPTIDFGDKIIIQEQNAYEVGDIVTFRSESGNSIVTHRIVEVSPDGYITQGDTNNARDPEIGRDRVIGKVIGTVPLLGKAILFFQQPLGITLLVIGLLAIVEAPILYKKWTHSESNALRRERGGE